jgi:hypothetical protein
MITNSNYRIGAIALAMTVLAGCATRPDAVVPTHVSAARYEDRTCKSLQRELDDVTASLTQASGRLNDKANQDAAVVGVGTILFWPVLFALGGNSGMESEVARLKGEKIALEQQIAERDCAAQSTTLTKAPAVQSATGVVQTSAVKQ